MFLPQKIWNFTFWLCFIGLSCTGFLNWSDITFSVFVFPQTESSHNHWFKHYMWLPDNKSLCLFNENKYLEIWPPLADASYTHVDISYFLTQKLDAISSWNFWSSCTLKFLNIMVVAFEYCHHILLCLEQNKMAASCFAQIYAGEGEKTFKIE